MVDTQGGVTFDPELGVDSEQNRREEELQRAHFSLTHATPLLPAPTLSEDECRVSTTGEPKGESTSGAASQFMRSSLEAQTGLPHFLRPSTDPWCVAMVEPPVSYLESTAPIAVCEIAVVCRPASHACFARRISSLRTPFPFVTSSELLL
jgi:hypothetical protein